MKSKRVIIQMKATELFFPVILLIMLYIEAVYEIFMSAI